MRNLFLWLTILLLAGCDDKVPPTDFDLINKYTKNRLVYEAVVSDVRNTPGITRISLGKNEIEMFDGIFDEATKEKYKKAFKQGMLPSVIDVEYETTGNNIKKIAFFEYRSGVLSGGVVKGIAFLNYFPPSARLVQHLDGYDIGNQTAGAAMYMPISNGWYLFYEKLN